MPAPIKDVFKLVQKTETCWNWTGSISERGYGRFSNSFGKHVLAHRVIYQMLVRKLTNKEILHHKCKNKLCVNPEHLEVLLQAKHPDCGGMLMKSRTHCPRGHEYTPENTLDYGSGRTCRVCQLERGKLWKRTHRTPGNRARKRMERTGEKF